MKCGWAVTCKKCYIVLFFSQESKTEFMFISCFLVNVIEELQHSEKQLFSSKKNIDIQHR